jgi:poly(3-hydroxybutyrate) depolymerase
MAVQRVAIVSSVDGSAQPAAFYDSGTPGSKPLLVALHTWSYDFDQEMSIPYAEWCIAHDWLLIAPSFRGPNNRPEAGGSELAAQDVLDAVAYARRRALSLSKRGPSIAQHSGRVDMQRIYLVGVSGGGYMALLMAGRASDLWAGVSAWAPIADLAAWHAECRAAGRPYADDLEHLCGGAPGDDPAVDAQYRARSPLAYLHPGIRTPLDINTGILDGHTGSVPISHALRAFNAVAAAEDRINEADIAFFVEHATVPPHLAGDWLDPLYGEKRVLFRRQSGPAHVTIFDGGHEIIYEAALNWLAGKIKRQASNVMNCPKTKIDV